MITAVRDRRVVLSTLWIFVLFNYIYADVFTLFFNPALVEEGKTFTGGSALVVLGAAVLMETAIAMVVVSRLAPYTVNRWANVAAGLLHTAAVAASASLVPYYILFATIEMACTLFIAWYAWRWRNAEIRSEDEAVQHIGVVSERYGVVESGGG